MDRCGNCRFFHKLKELSDKKWIIKSCCTLFPETSKKYEYNDFVLVVDEMDLCECFSDRSDNK